MADDSSAKFITADSLALRLGIPAAWLKREARANRIPHLRADRRILFDAEAVEDALRERMKQVAREPAAESREVVAA